MVHTVLLVFIPLSYLGLQVLALRRVRPDWQGAATLPATIMGLSLVMFAFGMLAGVHYTEIWLMAGLPLATLYLVILLVVDWATGRLRRA